VLSRVADALPAQCLCRRPDADLPVAAAFRTKQLLRERCTVTCQRRRRPGQVRRRQGRLQITAWRRPGVPGMAIPAARNSCSGTPLVRRRPTWPSLPEHRRHPAWRPVARCRPHGRGSRQCRARSRPASGASARRPSAESVASAIKLKIVKRGSPHPAGLLLDGYEVDRLDVRCAGQQVGRHLG
jgi:hypothetical protein